MQKGTNNKRKLKVIIILMFVLIMAAISSIYVIYENSNTYKLNAIVVKVNKDTIDVMEKDGESNDLYKVYFSKEGNIGFRQGQEVAIYHNQKYISEMGYYTIYKDRVKKINIMKEKSEIEIPKDILRFYYSSIEKISIDVEQITKNSISVRIKDLNEIPFEYSKFYSLCEWGNGQEIAVDESENKGKFYSITNGNEIKLTYSWSDKYGELEKRRI